jgi:PIN domain nuclease of toxin-antitoxin system
LASYLLDAHVFLWWLDDDSQLGPEARTAIEDPANDVFVSAASAWEISIKRNIGKLEAPGEVETWIAESGFSELAIEVEHAVHAGELPNHHKDPFDRMLIAQAQLEELILVARDDEINKYDVEVLDAAA